MAREDLVDPTTRAALSLQHLPKITTPYGFLTLGESPFVRRRESLFFKDDLTVLHDQRDTTGQHTLVD
jgi:hypothetical protein